MNQYPVELIGGPKDGDRHTLPHDLPVMKVLGPPAAAEYFKKMDEGSAEAITPVEYAYLRTGRVTKDGYRIYAYSELKRA